MRFPTIATWFGIWIGISRFDYSSMIQYPKTRKNIEGYYSMNIYEKIFARLEELHMSQIELSRRTGIATSTINDWRKKKINPQADKLVTICKALDMSLVDLLCDEEETEKQASTDLLLDEKHIIEVYRSSDLETKRRVLRYFELLEICRDINEANESKKIKRNVSVIQDVDGNNIVMINDIVFKGKRSVK